jgi:SAM-dependent methyltransferase
MEAALRTVDLRQGSRGAQDAWTAFWKDPMQSRCASGAPQIWQALTAHWSAFAESLDPGTRILDLGCGAGAVARLLLAARGDLEITGIDFARVPLTIYPRFELLSDTAMESLPFDTPCFGAVVSQFGFEYSDCRRTVDELARVLAPGARLSMLVHHANSAIVATNRARRAALSGFLTAPVRTAFCASDGMTFQGQMQALQQKHPGDTLIAELARCLPSRLGRTPRERSAIWKSLEDALAPECCLAESLDARCVEPEQIEQWLAPLRGLCSRLSISVLPEVDGTPIAWRVEGSRHG